MLEFLTDTPVIYLFLIGAILVILFGVKK